MKTSLHHLFAVAGLACALSGPALAASGVATPADSMPGTQTAPGATALPPGTLPSDPSMGNGGDASGSSVRPATRISPDIRENEIKDRKTEQEMQREQGASDTDHKGSTDTGKTGQ